MAIITEPEEEDGLGGKDRRARHFKTLRGESINLFEVEKLHTFF